MAEEQPGQMCFRRESMNVRGAGLTDASRREVHRFVCVTVCLVPLRQCVRIAEVKAKVQQEYLMAMDSLSSSQGLFKQWLNNEDPLD